MLLGDARSGKLAENMVGFVRTLRRAGLPIDSARSALALESLGHLGLERRDDVRAALACVLVSREQDLQVFEQLFDAYFRNPEWAQQLLSQMLPQAQEAKPSTQKARVQEALRANRTPSTPKEDQVDLDAAMSASDLKRIQHADFAQLSASEFMLVERLARQLPLPIPEVQARRTQSGLRGNRLDWSACLRESVRHEGEWLTLYHRVRRAQPLPLLVLVDVSGSMERYARLMLAYLHQATRGVPRQVFAFGTGLTDLNAGFRLHDTDAMLAHCNAQIRDFAGGTRLGESLQTLRQTHPQALLGRRTLVLLISDGLDTGDNGLLMEQVAWLKRHSRALLWLNPLLRFEGYAPAARGAQVLAQHADALLAIHNLSKLEALAKAMAQLLKRLH